MLSHDLEAAEDMAQDAFLRVAQRLGQLRRREAFWAYYRRTLVRLAIRRMQRARRLLADRALDPIVVWQPDVATRDELWRALGALSQRQRTVLVLRYYEDLEDAQISEIIGCRPSTVRSLAARGLTKLREGMDVTRDG